MMLAFLARLNLRGLREADALLAFVGARTRAAAPERGGLSPSPAPTPLTPAPVPMPAPA